MLQIIADACKFEPDMSKGIVVIESTLGGPPYNDAHDELNAKDAISLAQQYASQLGMAPAWLNGNKQGPYAVNAEGIPLGDVRGPKGEQLDPKHPRMQPAKYRTDIPLSRPVR